MHALQQRGIKIPSHLLHVTGGIIIFIDMLTRVSFAIDMKNTGLVKTSLSGKV